MTRILQTLAVALSCLAIRSTACDGNNVSSMPIIATAVQH